MNNVFVADEAQRATQRSLLRRSFLPTAKRWLREPLIHFLLIGVLLFAMDHYVQPTRGVAPSSKQIQLSLDDLSQMVMLFQSQWRREPTAQELARLVEDKVQEEILYREALAMGLEKDDTIVKRRMAQKLQFLAEDVATAHEPSTAELKAWYEKNRDKFALPSRVSFRHLYFSPDRRGQHARDDAVNALSKLAGRPQDSKLAASLADPFMFQDYYRDRAPDYLGKEFGPKFAQAVAKLAPGSWQGPIESGFGWHLVFVDTVIPGRVPVFEEIEPDVKTAWLSEQKVQAWQKAYKEMRAKYTVLIPSPPDTSAAKLDTSTGGNRGNGERFFYKNSVVSVTSCEKAMHSLFKKTSKLTETIIGSAIEVHRNKGPGLIESIYEWCLLKELELRGLSTMSQKVVVVEYKGFTREEPLRFDVLVEGCVLVEAKAVEQICRSTRPALELI